MKHRSRQFATRPYVAPMLLGLLSCIFFTGGFVALKATAGIRVRTVAIVIVFAATVISSMALFVARQRLRDGRGLQQFSLSGLVSLVAISCVFAGLLRWDFVASRAELDRFESLEQAMMEIIGKGTVNVATEDVDSSTAFIVRRSRFRTSDWIEQPFTGSWRSSHNSGPLWDQSDRRRRAIDSASRCASVLLLRPLTGDGRECGCVGRSATTAASDFRFRNERHRQAIVRAQSGTA